MPLYSSPEPDPCCVWSWPEKPSLCPAAPDFCSVLYHCMGGGNSAVHFLIESFVYCRTSFSVAYRRNTGFTFNVQSHRVCVLYVCFLFLPGNDMHDELH